MRVIDHITVGDSPEGLAISPKGDLAVTIEARGSNQPKSSWFYHPGGAVTALKIDGKKVTRAGEVTVGACPRARVQRRRQLSLRRQLHRPGFVGAAGQRRHAERCRPVQAAGPPGLDARRTAIALAAWRYRGISRRASAASSVRLAA